MKIPISHVLALRGRQQDVVILDYLTLAHLAPTPGSVDTWELARLWGCCRPQVSRRIRAVVAAGLADVSSGWGAYQVHHVHLPSEAL